MNSNIKTGIFWVILACVLVLLWQVVKAAKNPTKKEITFTEFISDVEAGKVKKVAISNGVDNTAPPAATRRASRTSVRFAPPRSAATPIIAAAPAVPPTKKYSGTSQVHTGFFSRGTS